MDGLNLFDFMAGGFSIWGMRRGYHHGFAKGVRRLLDYLLGGGFALAAYRGISDGIATAASLHPEMTAAPAFLLSGGGGFVVVRFIRRRLKVFILDAVENMDQLYGALLGLVRNGVLAGGGIFAAGVSNSDSMSGMAQGGSAYGRLIFSIFGG